MRVPPLIGTELTVLFLCLPAIGQLNYVAYERWNDMWLGQAANGAFGPVDDPCDFVDPINPCEFPAGSGMSYLGSMGLWIGALIDEQGFQSPRVSVTFDGWFDVQELHPAQLPITESSRLDTTGCLGAAIFDPSALADHEFTAIFADTLDDPFWVEDDPVDGPHRPLGLKVTRTTYVMRDAACNNIHWIKYHVENVGSNFLKNLYLGHFVNTTVRGPGDDIGTADDVCGFWPSHKVAYWADNDGRASGDSSGTDFNNPHATGLIWQPVELDSFGGIIETHARFSFNWWTSNGDPNLDFGPSWETYCDGDSLGLGWTGTYGTPVGDLRKYQLMRNGEWDYPQPLLSRPDEIPPQEVEIMGQPVLQSWCLTDWVPPSLHRGSEIRMLYSAGPLGVFEYVDASGNYIYRLNPGESFDCWAAVFGALDLHDPANPQTDPDSINIGYYNFMDLMAAANQVRNPACFSGWPTTVEPTATTPRSLSLGPLYPNPFNATATVPLEIQSAASVEIAAFDVMGRKAAIIARDVFSPGVHLLPWDAAGLASGIYFVRATVNQRVLATQKAMFLK